MNKVTEKTEIQERPQSSSFENLGGERAGKEGKERLLETLEKLGKHLNIKNTLIRYSLWFGFSLICNFTNSFVKKKTTQNNKPPFVLLHILFPPLSYGTKSYPNEIDISHPTVNSNKYYALTNLLHTFNIKQSLK